MALYSAIMGFASGVLLRSFYDGGLGVFFGFLAIAVVCVVGYLVLRNARMLWCALFLVFCAAGFLRMMGAVPVPDIVIEQLVGKHVSAEGVVVSERDVRETHQRLIVSLTRAEGHDVQAKALVTADLYPITSYGDVLHISGTLNKPGNFVTDTGREFDYQSYLAKDDILYQVSFADIEVIGTDEGNAVARTLFSIKEKFLERVQKVIPEPQVSLLGGLLVGAKQSLGSELQEQFRRTGIIHIVVLSGYNVTIVADALMKTFSFLPRFYGMGVGAVAIVLFALMTGASATIVRASIMALLVLLARATGRTYAITRALAIAGFAMVLHNPHILLHDPSFQLSFLATVGLIHVAPLLEKYVTWVPELFGLRTVVTATISTQLFVLPLLLYMTGEFSVVALPVNLLVLAFIPGTMLVGFIAGVLSFISTLLATPVAFIAHLLLSYELWIVDLFARLPFASIKLPTVSWWVVAIVYVVFIAMLLRVAPQRDSS